MGGRGLMNIVMCICLSGRFCLEDKVCFRSGDRAGGSLIQHFLDHVFARL